MYDHLQVRKMDNITQADIHMTLPQVVTSEYNQLTIENASVQTGVAVMIKALGQLNKQANVVFKSCFRNMAWQQEEYHIYCTGPIT